MRMTVADGDVERSQRSCGTPTTVAVAIAVVGFDEVPFAFTGIAKTADGRAAMDAVAGVASMGSLVADMSATRPQGGGSAPHRSHRSRLPPWT
mmetsp:Transcript_50949/g.111460  ORF Transcript_50949/g.111460 Transcript_50949/m.111460 type:complete len:93 (+) Transcript_50949:1339-1617(+)